MSVAAAIAGGLVSSAGQLYANHENIKANDDRFGAEVELANTAHRREMADLQAAGLNPILSASGSGASTPQLGAAQVESIGDKLGDSIQSAGRLASLEIPLKESQVALNSAQAINLASQNDNLKAQNDLIHAQADETRARTHRELGSPSAILHSAWSKAQEADKGMTIGDGLRKLKSIVKEPFDMQKRYEEGIKKARSFGWSNKRRRGK